MYMNGCYCKGQTVHVHLSTVVCRRQISIMGLWVQVSQGSDWIRLSVTEGACRGQMGTVDMRI